MNLRKRIRELIDILDAEGIDEIEVRTLWSSVRVARRGNRAAQSQTFAQASSRACLIAGSARASRLVAAMLNA